MNLTMLCLAVAGLAAPAAWLLLRRHRWEGGTVAAGLTLGCLYIVSITAVAVLWAAAAVIAAGGVAFVLYRRGLSRTILTRWGKRARRTSGVATTVEIARKGSAAARRRKAPIVRPSLAGVSRYELRRMHPAAYSVLLARVGVQKVYASHEDVIIVYGGTRTGKTGWMTGAMIDAPGAVVATSTRLDSLLITRPFRETRGPVRIFNPGGLGSLRSDVQFSPLLGCADPVTATERAGDMIPDATGERAFWDSQARRVLAAHLHAAALGGRTMHHVLGWIADPTGQAKREVPALLRDSTQPSFVKAAHQFQTTNDRTQTSTTSAIMPALEWLSSPAAVDATRVEGDPFDVDTLLRERGTVYLLGRKESYTSALLAAFVGYIARRARMIAAEQPGGRIDPALHLFLDEAGRSAPVPLDDWTGDAGGSGICIVAGFQSRADVESRWGKLGAAKINNNATSVMLFGGTKDETDLRIWSELAGQRDEVTKTYGPNHRVTSRSTHKVPVFTPAQLSNLPDGHAVLYVRGMAPVIGRPPMSWDRKDVKAAAENAEVIARRAKWEKTLDRAWESTWVAGAGGEVVAAAEHLARIAEKTSTAAPAAPVDLGDIGPIVDPHLVGVPQPRPGGEHG